MKQVEKSCKLGRMSVLLALVLPGCTAAGAASAGASPVTEAEIGPYPMWISPSAKPNPNQNRQVYYVSPETAKANAALVAKDLEKVPDQWKNAPILYYVVDAMSDIKRVPDLYPEDGKAAGRLDYIAARGEFEPASFLVYARQNANKFTFTVSDLKNKKNGDVIPASAIDAKLVKVWYQCGSGWFGQMADPLRHTLTPELLINDEKMIFVDPNTQDNYARYSNADGSTHYEWISHDFQATNYSFCNVVRIGNIKDADTLQPVVLNKGEFKQFMLTLHVPKTAKGGTYEGTITMNVDGKAVGTVPVHAGVLDFELPKARTCYDVNKRFYLNMYCGYGGNPAIMENLVSHNMTHDTPNLTAGDTAVRKELELFKKYGVETKPLFFAGPGGAAYTVWGNKPLTEKQQKDIDGIQKKMTDYAALSQKYLGHTEVYNYAADEAPYAAVKGERHAWRAVHAAGMRVMVTTHNDKRNLFPLDFMILPRMPSKDRAEIMAKFHESHPNGLCGWYADPHSGPENPDHFRRIHGLMAYKAGYDFSANYCWYRNDWNDMAICYESNYRGIICVYAVHDRIINTLAWEGVREGLDDIRYASKVKLLAMEAEKSKDPDTLNLGRLALGYITYWDSRENPDTFRMECVNYILKLEKALKKEQK